MVTCYVVGGQTGDRLVVLGIVFVSEHVDRCLGRRAGWRAVNHQILTGLRVGW